MRYLVTLALLLLPNIVQADEPRFRSAFISPNRQYELSESKSERWLLIEKATGQVRYQVVGEFASRTVLVSDDGINLVVVDDFSERRPGHDLDVLVFYRNGSIVKKYLLGDLLRDVTNIERSVSHFQWFFISSALSLSDARLKLKTFELIDYEFDASTGELLKKETDPILSEDTIYVYGQVKKLGGERFEIEVCQQVYGAVPPTGTIEFAAERNDIGYLANSYYSVVIKNGKLAATQPVILNSCNYRNGLTPSPNEQSR